MVDYRQPAKKVDKEIKVAKDLLKKLNIKYCINWSHTSTWCLGYAMPSKIIVFTKKAVDVVITKKGNYKWKFIRCSKQQVLSTILHEIQHILMLRNKKFITYHSGFDPNKDSYKVFLKWSKEALKAERNADSMGKEMMKDYFPDIPFKATYDGYYGENLIKQYNTYICQVVFPKKIKHFKKVMGY